MKVIPTRTFLLRQEGEGKKAKDVIAVRGEEIEVSDTEYKRFSNSFEEVAEKKVKGPLTTKQ